MLQIPEVQHMLSLHKNLQEYQTMTEYQTTTLTGCEFTPNVHHKLSFDTGLIMDVTIGHVFYTHHNFKPNTSRSLSNSKCPKCLVSKPGNSYQCIWNPGRLGDHLTWAYNRIYWPCRAACQCITLYILFLFFNLGTYLPYCIHP
jgi:hypothetical protein